MFDWRITALVALVIVFFGGVSLAQELNRRWEIQQDVERLRQSVESLEREAIVLQNLNQYFRTDEYQERLAREKLNYSAPGEKVVLIPEDIAMNIESEVIEATQKGADLRESIPVLWWETFFP